MVYINQAFSNSVDRSIAITVLMHSRSEIWKRFHCRMILWLAACPVTLDGHRATRAAVDAYMSVGCVCVRGLQRRPNAMRDPSYIATNVAMVCAILTIPSLRNAIWHMSRVLPKRTVYEPSIRTSIIVSCPFDSTKSLLARCHDIKLGN